MTKSLAMAASAILLLAGTHVAVAQHLSSCAREAAAARHECLAAGGRDRIRVIECNALYRDDLRECRRFGRDPYRRW